MLLSSLVLLFLPLLEVVHAAAKPTVRCLHSGTERQINEAFHRGGKGAVVTLCQGSVHRLNESIAFTAPRQTLTTEGDPKGRERAMIIVEGEKTATAIFADCDQCSYATIQSLIVDGNRPQLLRIPKGGALIETGNGEGQTVKNCRLYEPRGWSALHYREGNRKQCRTGLVQDNEIGPCGEEWDDEYDGDMTSKPMWGFPNADGISVACAETIVERNTIFDTTDGAIVIFGSTGSQIRNNHIFSRTRVILGGINLVDYDPFNGDFTGVHVHHNTLHALSAFLKVGIVAGPSSWSDDTETTVHGASITDNILHGQHFGYGIVVSSAKDFTVLRNKIDDDAGFGGVDGPRCPRAPENARPKAFLINKGSASGTFQEDFKNGEVQHIICINPPDVEGKAYKAWRLRDSPESIAAGELAHPELAKTTIDSKLADAVVAYQMTLLKAVDDLNHRVEALTADPTIEQDNDNDDLEPRTGNPEIDDLAKLLAGIDNDFEHSLISALESIKADVGKTNSRWLKSLVCPPSSSVKNWQTGADRVKEEGKPYIVKMYSAVEALWAANTETRSSGGEMEQGGARAGKVDAFDTVVEDDLTIEGSDDSGILGEITPLMIGGMLGFLGWSAIRRWRAGRTDKGNKLV